MATEAEDEASEQKKVGQAWRWEGVKTQSWGLLWGTLGGVLISLAGLVLHGIVYPPGSSSSRSPSFAYDISRPEQGVEGDILRIRVQNTGQVAARGCSARAETWSSAAEFVRLDPKTKKPIHPKRPSPPPLNLLSATGFVKPDEVTDSIDQGETHQVIVHFAVEKVSKIQAALETLARSRRNVAAYVIPNPMSGAVIIRCTNPSLGQITIPLTVDTVRHCVASLTCND